MARKSLYRVTIRISGIYTGYSSGDTITVYWDDTANDFVVFKNTTQINSGPELGEQQQIGPTGVSFNPYTFSIYPPNSTIYQFCNGGDLNYFEFQQSFPYAARKIEINSTACNTNIVCDVNFIGVAQITKPSTATATDGEITVVATTSNGTIKYSLQNEDYSEMTNTTGVFTGLGIGTYVVYAKDDYNCQDSIIVIVEAEINYAAKYRIEYDCLNGDVTVVDIQERDFSGSVTEVAGTDAPFTLRLRGEDSDLFTPILATEATMALVSETDLQFIDLFTQDDRKYRVLAKKNGTEFWRGFISPGLYTEQYYTDRNYYVTVDCTDQLARLKDFDFLDKDNNKIKGVNSLIKIIAFILSKTDLDLPIRSAVGVFEVDMATTAADDALAQTHIDTEAYYSESGEPKDCYTILNDIVLSFGARITQWAGYWYIIPVDFFTGTITYREFNTNGDYVSNGSYNPVFNIKTPTDTNRATWAKRTQMLEIRKAFGYSQVTHNLIKKPLSVINGNFEDVDIETKTIVRNTGLLGSLLGNNTSKQDVIVEYNDWSLILNGNNASYTYTNKSTGNNKGKVDATGTNYAGTIYSESNGSSRNEDAYFLGKEQPITYQRGDAINFKFDFYTETNNVKEDFIPPVVRFKWRVQVGTYYLQADGSWTTDTSLQWVEVQVGSEYFESWQTIEIKTFAPDEDLTTTTFQISLMHGSFLGGGFLSGLSGGVWEYPGNGVTGNASLKSIVTTNKPLGYVVWVKSITNAASPTNGKNSVIDFYRLVKGKVSTDSNKINSISGYTPSSVYGLIVPNDYNASTNKVNWQQFASRGYDANETLLNNPTYVPDYQFVDGTPKVAVRKFDNVSLELLPQNNISPSEFVYTTNNDTRIKDVNKLEIINGDVPNGITNAQNLYINWYRYSDGTPTVVWGRTGVDELQPLLQLLTKRIIEQHNLPKYKLTGSVFTDTFFAFINSLYEQRSQKYFVPMGMTINDKICQYDLEITEVALLTTTGAEDIGEFNPLEFNNEFNI